MSATDGSALTGISDIRHFASCRSAQVNQYTSATQSLNSGSAFTLTVTPGTGSAVNVSVEAGNDTPQGIVNAINAANAGINATLLAEDSSGSNYRIMLDGATGAANSFVISSTLSDSDLGFHDTSNGNSADNSGTKSLQNPADAAITGQRCVNHS